MSDIKVQMFILMATNLTLAAALSEALVMLSEFRGREDVEWLEELEAKFIDGLKNSYTEGLSEKNEVKVIDGALAFLRLAIDDARSQIAETAKNE